MRLIGWSGAYTTNYNEVKLSDERRRLIIDCVRKRNYDFNYSDLCLLPYCAPIFDDLCICIPTKTEWDDIMKESYSDIYRSARQLPIDVLSVFGNDILFENEKYKKEVCRC